MDTLYIREGDTEPFEVEISATGLTNLDALTNAKLYMRKMGEATNHVDGKPMAVVVSADRTLSFDPVGNGPSGGNAFGAGSAGRYFGYVLATWNDGDTTRHPGKNRGGYPLLEIVVSGDYE